ncbi:MAG TPA: PAS domain-containing protein [Gammaproteobacteria bacterium]|nr:PAS domain-containing protein [Gammaproteobacteria bacterium]
MPDTIALRALLGALHEHALFLVLDEDERIVEISEPLAAVVGCRPLEAALGRDCFEALGLILAPTERAGIGGALQARRAWQGLLHGRRGDGIPFTLQTALLPMVDAAGSHTRTIALATEVSAHERLRLAYQALVNPGTEVGLFPGIARIVATGLDCRGALVGRVTEDGAHVQVLGYWLDEVQQEVPFSFALAGTPCERCLCEGRGFTVIEQDAAVRFPHDRALAELGIVSYRGAALRDRDAQAIGLLVALDNRPCRHDPDDLAFLQIAAQRAADELLRAEAAERLRVSEAGMRFALESAELGLHEWDLDRGVSRYNERWATMRGYGAQEAVPDHLHSERRLHPDDVSHVEPHLAALRRGEIDTFSAELRTRTKGDGWRWIDAHATVLERHADGNPKRVVSLQRDIHERRLAEQELREKQQWLQLVLDATELGIWDWNPLTQHIVYDARCAQIVGFRSQDMPRDARDWQAYTHPDDLPYVLEHFRAHVVRRETATLRVEYRTRAGDGRWMWVLNWGRVIERDEAGRAVRAVGVFQDISQLKNAEAALRESEARLRTIVDNSPVGIFLCDLRGGIVYRNQTLCLIHGTGPDDDYGLGWQRFVHPDDVERVLRDWGAYARDPQGLHDTVWRACTPRRGERLLRIRTAAIREDKRVLGFAGTVEDITDQRETELRERRLQRQLQQAQKMEAIGQLTGGIAHDFNNSLATILGFAALAGDRCAPGDAKQRQYLDAIRQAGEHARDLVEKMLAFSRSAPHEELQAVAVPPLIAEAKRMLQSVIPATVQIATIIEDGAPPVQMDATAFNQILFNLVLNARDAIAEHGHIRVCLTGLRRVRGECTACRVAIDEDYVELSVADDGAGIPADHLHRIFDPFFSTKEVGKGTGMGLSMLHGIVHRAGGHVIVESTPGSGTAMRVLLQAAAAMPAMASSTEAAHAGAPPQAHVLIVDDNPSVANFMRELLENHGYRTTVFNDPGEALSWLERTDALPDVLVSDQTMPGLTGLELLAALRPRHPRLPALLCTGLTDRVDAELARDCGVRRVFLKPIQTAEFLAELAACVLVG